MNTHMLQARLIYANVNFRRMQHTVWRMYTTSILRPLFWTIQEALASRQLRPPAQYCLLKWYTAKFIRPLAWTMQIHKVLAQEDRLYNQQGAPTHRLGHTTDNITLKPIPAQNNLHRRRYNLFQFTKTLQLQSCCLSILSRCCSEQR